MIREPNAIDPVWYLNVGEINFKQIVNWLIDCKGWSLYPNSPGRC